MYISTVTTTIIIYISTFTTTTRTIIFLLFYVTFSKSYNLGVILVGLV